MYYKGGKFYFYSISDIFKNIYNIKEVELKEVVLQYNIPYENNMILIR